MEEFSEKLKETRKEIKLSQKELSNIVGVSDKTIYRWENGTSCPSVKQKEVIAECLGLRKDYFYNEFEKKNIVGDSADCKNDKSKNFKIKKAWTVLVSVFLAFILLGITTIYIYFRIYRQNLSTNATIRMEINLSDIFLFMIIFVILLAILFFIHKTRNNKKEKIK